MKRRYWRFWGHKERDTRQGIKARSLLLIASFGEFEIQEMNQIQNQVLLYNFFRTPDERIVLVAKSYDFCLAMVACF